MKSIVAIDIHRPRREVSMLLADPGNMTKWMHDLAAYEHIGGETGAVGAQYRMVPKPGTRQSAFVSTVTAMHLPERLSLRLQSPTVDVLVDTTFTALGKDRTKLVSEEKFILPRPVPPPVQPLRTARHPQTSPRTSSHSSGLPKARPMASTRGNHDKTMSGPTSQGDATQVKLFSRPLGFSHHPGGRAGRVDTDAQGRLLERSAPPASTPSVFSEARAPTLT